MDEMELLEEALQIIRQLLRVLDRYPYSNDRIMREAILERIRHLPGFKNA